MPAGLQDFEFAKVFWNLATKFIANQQVFFVVRSIVYFPSLSQKHYHLA